MFIYIARLAVIIAGPVIGYMKISADGKGILIGTAAAVLVIAIELLIQSARLDDLVAGGIGLILGLVAASIINNVIPTLVDNPKVYEVFKKYSLLVSVISGYVGLLIALKKKGEIDLLDKEIHLTGSKLYVGLKVLDSSAIIDGRILEVSDTSFIEGVLVIPGFVMSEVQATADSPQEEKRKKARRALDIVNELRENEKLNVKIHVKDYEDIEETDAKLIKLCQELKAKLITTDFNLTKAARAQGVEALNINELANSLKPKLLPGEAIEIFILKKGKEKEQGIGFLEDGTMVVVDGGLHHIGDKVEVTVKTVLQKPSGRMIFARVN
ncbi:MAG: TRAM domain-containing protein [Elusimicrobia bacterium]|nr:TRAM domain-containing protein [Elusimicrobiota bacterium]